MNETLHQRIERDFTNHPPVDAEVVKTMEHLRSVAKEFAGVVADMCPAGREQSLSLTFIEQGLMFAIAAVARDGH